MKLDEITKMTESINFDVGYFDEKEKYFASAGTSKEIECDFCDGMGKDPYDKEHDCDWCSGTGKRTTFVPDYPSINLSNSNGLSFLETLGIEDPDYVGHIKKDQLPEIKKRLMLIINSDKIAQAASREQSVTKGKAKITKKEIDGQEVDSISTGPTFIDVGQTPERIKQIAREFLKMVEYAQKNDYLIAWG